MERKKNIIIWLRSSQKETFTAAYHKGASYLQLADCLSARNNLFFAYGAASCYGNDIFYPVVKYADGKFIPPHEHGTGKIKADIIYNLGNIPDENFATDTARISNTPAFRKFFTSKFDVYKLLPEFFPKTFFVNSEQVFFEVLKNIRGERAVLKPNTGTGGRSVHIFPVADVRKEQELDMTTMKATIAEGALLQEFIDTKNGIAGIGEGYHDLRLAVVNDVIALTHVRTPAAGSLIANYQQGATIKELAVEDLPEAVIALHKKIHAKITERFPVPMYTMDVGVDGATGAPLLFEINGTTAFPWPDFAGKDFFIEQLATHLERL